MAWWRWLLLLGWRCLWLPLLLLRWLRLRWLLVRLRWLRLHCWLHCSPHRCFHCRGGEKLIWSCGNAALPLQGCT